jgi:hypothetical protein
MTERQTWPRICQNKRFQGRWIALDRCRYDENTMQPLEGDVVDADENLAALCSRMREAGRGSCSIHFCDDIEPGSVPGAPRSAAAHNAATN